MKQTPKAPSRYNPSVKGRCLAQIPEAGQGRRAHPDLVQCRFRAVEDGPYCSMHAKIAARDGLYPAKMGEV